jgi:UDP-N-acetylmuramoyl-tripeptide--D-alanyl-D-alanine ligase
MTVLWTAQDALAATAGNGDPSWQANGVSIDSRAIEPGDLFVALAGPSHDGHDHVAAALAAGATAAMVERHPDGVTANAPLLLVANSQKGLEALGQAGRTRFGGKVIGLTGSVGKTGTKEMLHHMLSQQGQTLATRGNLNNHIGTPLTLARLPREADFAVIELGMNHPGEIRPISQMTRPHVALITRIAPAHTAFFASLDEVAAAKAEIFEGLEAGGTAIVNADDGFGTTLGQAAKRAGANAVLSFGEASDADSRLLQADLQADGSFVQADILGTTLAYRLGAPGQHWVHNSLGALADVAAIGGDIKTAASALATIRPPPGRGATERLVLPQGAITLIDESYNASPAAMRAAFAVLCRHKPASTGRRVAILGDMLELGANAEGDHAELGRALAELPIATVFAAGSEMPALMATLRPEQRAGHSPNAAALAVQIVSSLREGDVVLVKGSLGIGMARIISALREAASEKGKADAV